MNTEKVKKATVPANPLLIKDNTHRHTDYGGDSTESTGRRGKTLPFKINLMNKKYHGGD